MQVVLEIIDPCPEPFLHFYRYHSTDIILLHQDLHQTNPQILSCAAPHTHTHTPNLPGTQTRPRALTHMYAQPSGKDIQQYPSKREANIDFQWKSGGEGTGSSVLQLLRVQLILAVQMQSTGLQIPSSRHRDYTGKGRQMSEWGHPDMRSCTSLLLV